MHVKRGVPDSTRRRRGDPLAGMEQTLSRDAADVVRKRFVRAWFSKHFMCISSDGFLERCSMDVRRMYDGFSTNFRRMRFRRKSFYRIFAGFVFRRMGFRIISAGCSSSDLSSGGIFYDLFPMKRQKREAIGQRSVG